MRCVISQMRTGSTMYAEMIAGDDHNLLFEIGTRKLGNSDLPDREIFDFYFQDNNTILDRFDRYKKMPIKPTIKLIPGLVPTHMLDWCLANVDCVFLDRRDKLAQILSYGVARYTNWWFQQKDRLIRPGSIQYLKPDFAYFAETMRSFDEIRTQHQDKAIIYYEDLTAVVDDRLPKKNKQGGLDLFSNPDEILEWYDGFVQR